MPLGRLAWVKLSVAALEGLSTPPARVQTDAVIVPLWSKLVVLRNRLPATSGPVEIVTGVTEPIPVQETVLVTRTKSGAPDVQPVSPSASRTTLPCERTLYWPEL